MTWAIDLIGMVCRERERERDSKLDVGHLSNANGAEGAAISSSECSVN